MRNPLRTLVSRPSDKPSLRDRLNATRERWRRRPAVIVSPELARLIAESDRTRAALDADAEGGDWPDRKSVRQDVEARAAVIRFPSAGAADTGAKLALLGRIEGASAMRDEVRRSLDRGNAYNDDLTLTIVAELLEMGGIGPASATPLAPRPDPIFGLIEEARRLNRDWERLFAISSDQPEWEPDAVATGNAHAAMWNHIRGTLLKTVPTTAAGCIALVRFTCEFTEEQGVPIEVDSNDPVLALIARSPAL